MTIEYIYIYPHMVVSAPNIIASFRSHLDTDLLLSSSQFILLAVSKKWLPLNPPLIIFR